MPKQLEQHLFSEPVKVNWTFNHPIKIEFPFTTFKVHVTSQPQQLLMPFCESHLRANTSKICVQDGNS